MTLVQFERSKEDACNFCHLQPDEFCQCARINDFISVNLETFAVNYLFNSSKLNETADFVETPVKWALKVGEPGYF